MSDFVKDTNVPINDCISRQDAIDAIIGQPPEPHYPSWYEEQIKTVPSAQQWIPVKTRPMTEEERWDFEEHTGVQLDKEDSVYFDCKMPSDRQRIWVQTKNGYIFDDVCERDDFIGLEGNGDWDDIVAWMPMFVPEPWEGGAS